MPILNLPTSKVARWRPSTYRDASKPSLVFRLVAVGFVLTWVILTGWIVTRTTTYGSPDEAANALFGHHLATSGEYRINTGLPPDVMALLHPRSIAVQGQFLASGSFLGLVQINALTERAFGVGSERMVTPLIALVGLIAIYFVFRRFWSRWWSLLGAVLIALHPAFFTYATLPYLHNGAFAAGLLIAGWALMRLLEWPTLWRTVTFGALFGFALYFRPVEALWTVPIVGILLLARRLWWPLVLSGVITLVMHLPWFLGNQASFGSFLSSGYTTSGVFSDEGGVAAIAKPAKILFTPPGGEWNWYWLSTMWWYYILFLPTWSVMSVIAIGKYVRRKFTNWQKALKLSGLFIIALFPFVYYGTWNLYPTIPASINGAFAAYVRYWLPLYLAMTPGVILILQSLRTRWVIGIVVSVMFVSQAVIIWTQPVAGLQARFTSDAVRRTIRADVLAATEPNAVIFAGSNDKVLQGDRLSGWPSPTAESSWPTLSKLIDLRPVYVLSPGADTAVFSAHGYAVMMVGTTDRFTLYRIDRRP